MSTNLTYVVGVGVQQYWCVDGTGTPNLDEATHFQSRTTAEEVAAAFEKETGFDCFAQPVRDGVPVPQQGRAGAA